jgi:hypothetical protein
MSKKAMRTKVGFHPSHSAIPPQTPAISRFFERFRAMIHITPESSIGDRAFSSGSTARFRRPADRIDLPPGLSPEQQALLHEVIHGKIIDRSGCDGWINPCCPAVAEQEFEISTRRFFVGQPDRGAKSPAHQGV